MVKPLEKTSNSWITFSRVWGSVLIIAILTVIFLNIINANPIGTISSEALTLFFLLSVIVLSEQFDKFAIGSLFSLSKAHNRTLADLKDSKNESERLKENLIALAMNVSQKQSNVTNVCLDSDSMVKKASEEAISKKYSDSYSEEMRSEPTFRNMKTFSSNTSIIRENIEKQLTQVIEDYLDKRGISRGNLIRDVQLLSLSEGAFKLVTTPLIFDGFVNAGEKELFFEVKLAHVPVRMLEAKINVMLIALERYQNVKQINAQLVLLLKKVEAEDLHKLQVIFEPAITKGLLSLESV